MKEGEKYKWNSWEKTGMMNDDGKSEKSEVVRGSLGQWRGSLFWTGCIPV